MEVEERFVCYLLGGKIAQVKEWHAEHIPTILMLSPLVSGKRSVSRIVHAVRECSARIGSKSQAL